MKKNVFLLAFLVLFSFVTFAQQNQVELVIEPLDEKEAYDIKGGKECHPGDIVFTIKSDLPNLTFDSNVVDITSPAYNPQKGEYIFCHSKESFWLTIASPKHIAKKIYIDGNGAKYAFRVVEKAALGKVFFKTSPNNALVDFGFSGQSPQLTASPIEMNAGEYKIRISKNGYMSMDTTIVVPSDGSTRQVEVSLRPTFGKIFLDISSKDKIQFQMLPVIDIDTAHVNMADLQIKEKLRSFDAAENVQYFKLYEGGYIPVPAGSYSVTVNSPGFKTFSTQVIANRGGTTPLSVKMTPVLGYLTVLDQGNAMDAEVFVDDVEVGKIPLFKHPIRIGSHKIKLRKSGFLSEEEEYPVDIQENALIDLPVAMSIYKDFYVQTEPAGAEVLVNEKRYGFTPIKISLKEGSHEMVVRRTGMADIYKQIVIDKNRTPDIDSIKYEFAKAFPVLIESEQQGLTVLIKRDNNILHKNQDTPANVMLSSGKYMIELYENTNRRFKGWVDFKNQKSIKLPCYSKGTFTALVGDFSFGKPKALDESGKSYYRLIATGSLGRFNLFPGVSTSILKTSIFQVDENFKGKEWEMAADNGSQLKNAYSNFMFAGSFLFLNGEIRLGGAILRQLDVAALGMFTYYPSLTLIGKPSELGANHIGGHDYFVGLEISSRFSPFNMNLKIGKDVFKGEYYFLSQKNGNEKQYHKVPFNMNNFGIKLGFTLGRNPAKGNNMIRLWNKPLSAGY